MSIEKPKTSETHPMRVDFPSPEVLGIPGRLGVTTASKCSMLIAFVQPATHSKQRKRAAGFRERGFSEAQNP